MPNFHGSILGTKGGPGPTTKGKHPGDKPLSLDGEAYAAQLWKETDASIRYDLARYGEIRRWSWKTLAETKLHRGAGIGKRWRSQPA